MIRRFVRATLRYLIALFVSFVAVLSFVPSVSALTYGTTTINLSHPSGYLRNSGTTWSTVRDTLTGAATDGPQTTLQAWSYKFGTTYAIRRAHLIFDTSVLQDDANIRAVRLCMKEGTRVGAPVVHVVTSTPSVYWFAQASDYLKFGSTSLGSVTPTGVPGTNNCVYLNATGRALIQTTSSTMFGLRENLELTNTPPATQTTIDFYGMFYSSPNGFRPTLTIGYDVPDPSISTTTVTTTNQIVDMQEVHFAFGILLFVIFFAVGYVAIFRMKR